MINDQITDSITQIIKYKEGEGSGQPSEIIVSPVGKMLYDDALLKYVNPSVPHLPTIEECDVLHHHMPHVAGGKKCMTSELRDDKTITIADIDRGIYTGASRSEEFYVLLVEITYES